MNSERKAPAGTTPRPIRERPLAQRIREFLDTESAGGITLLVAAVVALLWANSPWRGTYDALWHTEIAIRIGGWEMANDLRHWINDAAMTLFFLVVGAEIKRELTVGELNSPRAAALPALAALGGMIAPAAIYLAVNAGTPGTPGWGIPVATDIAFALAVLAVLGDRVPSGLKVLLLGIAIADDIGAIVLIAVFYSHGINPASLAVAVAILAVMVALRRAGIWWIPLHIALGTGVWFAVYFSGVHATIAGVALGLLAPAQPLNPHAPPPAAHEHPQEWTRPYVEWIQLHARETVPIAERLTSALHPWTSFLIVPVFALANAGVSLVGDEGSARVSLVTIGVVAGLVLGKPLGITLAAWLAVRLRLGTLPEGVGWAQVIGMSVIAGIGFTVSLFIADLAFTGADVALGAQARLGVLAASAVAAVSGYLLLRTLYNRQGNAHDTSE